MKDIVRKIIIGLILAVITIAFSCFSGRTYTETFELMDSSLRAEDIEFRMEQDHEILKLEGYTVENGTLKVTYSSVSAGEMFVDAYHGDEGVYTQKYYVHPTGIITVNEYFGDYTGDVIVPLMASLYIAYLLFERIRKYRKIKAQTIYTYRNVRNLGLIIFLVILLAEQMLSIFRNPGVVGSIKTAISTASTLTWLVLPAAFITSIYVTYSNIDLMRKEGYTWRNMLGVILGLLILAGTFVPFLLSEFFQRTSIIDVHNERGAWLYLTEYLQDAISAIAAYLECILAGTIVYATRAARSVPSFDQDYILILGCQIMPDGTLTKLLQGRADRALEFARMQKEANGKEICFVPSGGQGSDEVMPEAKAITNYLLEQGIPAERILTEDRSVNTYENFRNSLEMIRKDSDRKNPNIAFSTTNYHVFRSGVLAHEMGIDARGIGAQTRSYFWINAFIREFIAVLNAEKKTHAAVFGLILILMAVMVAVIYISVSL